MKHTLIKRVNFLSFLLHSTEQWYSNSCVFFFFYNLQEQNGMHLIRTSWMGTRIRKRERRIQKRVRRGVLFPVECQIKSFIIKIQTCLKIPKYFECMKCLKLYEKVFFFPQRRYIGTYLLRYLHRYHVFILFISIQIFKVFFYVIGGYNT